MVLFQFDPTKNGNIFKDRKLNSDSVASRTKQI